MRKISDTKKSKDNITGAANGGKNKGKYYNQREKDQNSNNNPSGNKN